MSGIELPELSYIKSKFVFLTEVERKGKTIHRQLRTMDHFLSCLEKHNPEVFQDLTLNQMLGAFSLGVRQRFKNLDTEVYQMRCFTPEEVQIALRRDIEAAISVVIESSATFVFS